MIHFGGPHSTVNSILASRPRAPGSILGVPKIFSEIISRKILDVIEIYRQHLDSGQCKSLIVDRTHPVLVRAVLQKTQFSLWCNNRMVRPILSGPEPNACSILLSSSCCKSSGRGIDQSVKSSGIGSDKRLIWREFDSRLGHGSLEKSKLRHLWGKHKSKRAVWEVDVQKG